MPEHDATTLKVVAVSGSLHEPSKTTALIRAIVGEVAMRETVDVEVIELIEIGSGFAGALTRDQVSPRAEAALRSIETADLLVVGSPVYRGSFTGLFKHLFDFVGQYELVDTPVLLAATGGGEKHALILEHQFRPLFGFFQALTLPIGVYASNTDFTGYELTSDAVRSRVELAVRRGLPFVRQRGIPAEVPASTYVGTW
ncbi:FMN reductase [Paramicrobacterium agarici]|uniref:FMN reductase n=1 Tax=Paramicrobacterium agarici TaxID=630514 RepID=A0A2A9E0Z0_9MICO|nr:FMN reductase [Microbacterium agarici]PFG31859.1 FMN reductase [Microbacterium agarici]